MTETPEEMYGRLSNEKSISFISGAEYRKLLNHYRSQVQVLREAVHQITEVYIGSDGFKPETAPEAYQQHLIKQMYDEATKALEATTDKWP